MNRSNSDQEYPDYEPEEGVDPEESAHADDPHSLFEELSDAPDLSEDPSEMESGEFFDWEDLFETIPYWSARTRSADPRMDSNDPDFEVLDFEGFATEDPEVDDRALEERQWDEGYLPPKGSSRQTQKKTPTRAKEKARDPARIERLARAIYTSGASAGRTNILAHPADPRKKVGDPYASADLAEARQLLYHLALAAQSAGTADEASGLASALLPVALRLYPQETRGLWPALPALAASISWLAGELYATPQYRNFMAWLPKILESTLDSLANKVRARQPVTSHLTAALFARRAASLFVELTRTSQRDQRRPNGKKESKPGSGRNGHR